MSGNIAIYAGATIFTAVALVYATIMFFSHVPRAPTLLELRYVTNDKKGETHLLPPRIDSSGPGTPSDDIEITVVIPCYNETKRLGKMLDEAGAYLESHHAKRYEIVIVDDGSLDGTDAYALEKARDLQLAPHVMRVVKLSKNRGKGGAVTHGLLHARGRLALFADADGATRFSDVALLVNAFSKNENPAVAIGLRAHMVNTDAVVKRLFIRNFLMYGLHTLVYIFGIRKVQDTQCGFKMFNRKALSMIFPHMHTERWIFDVEVLLLAELQNISIHELPVNWEEIDGSKVDLAKDSIGMAIDLVVTRLAYLLGVYKLDECGRAGRKQA